MERKLLALFFVALLGGLGGGFGLGYVIYQPQIQNIQNDLGRTWHEVYSIGALQTLQLAKSN